MTCENERGWTGTHVNSAKWEFLNAFSEKAGRSEGMDTRFGDLYGSLLHDDGNFMMFPISSHRMIVVINKFFKFYWSLKDHYPDLPLITDTFTEIGSEDLFAPNAGGVASYAQETKLTDRFQYTPVRMTPMDCWYCNSLFMDRVDTWFGFAHREKVLNRIDFCNSAVSGIPLRNDYPGLYRALGLRQPETEE